MSGNSSRQRFTNQECSTNALVCVPGSFETDGTGAPINSRGDGFTVARTAVGKYTITFAEKYPACVSFVPSFEDTAAGTLDDSFCSSEPYAVATGTVLIRVAVNSIITESNGPRINFVGYFNRLTANAVTHA